MNILANFPQQIAVNSSSGRRTYKIAPDLYAIHGRPKSSAKDAVYVLNEGEIAVFRGQPDQTSLAGEMDKVSPVYSLVPAGTRAVPTGLVFVRFAAGTAIEEHEDAIKNAGYEVAETLPYAPNAAWLRARSGDIAEGLTGLEKLEEIPTAESVEPQMLMEAARR
jgi:hypothetical protein